MPEANDKKSKAKDGKEEESKAKPARRPETGKVFRNRSIEKKG